jgi:hypothetical protein
MIDLRSEFFVSDLHCDCITAFYVCQAFFKIRTNQFLRIFPAKTCQPLFEQRRAGTQNVNCDSKIPGHAAILPRLQGASHTCKPGVYVERDKPTAVVMQLKLFFIHEIPPYFFIF